MHWNYRVVESLDHTEHFIAEVFYNLDGDDLAWAPCGEEALRYENDETENSSYSALKNTLQAMLTAFDKPTLRVTENDKLVETEESK